MKKSILLPFLLVFLGTTIAFANAESTEDPQASKILIAYFTLPENDGVDAVAGASRVIHDGEILGNTEYIARAIQQSTGRICLRSRQSRSTPSSTTHCCPSRVRSRMRGHIRS